MAAPLTITCHADQAGTPLRHAWSRCVGAGRANEGLRADWQAHLDRAVAECGFQYLRFHGLFHDDMFVYREDAEGRPHYNWQYIDALFDAMLEIGIRPFVELGFMPNALATRHRTCFWWGGHGSPPKDYDKWAGLVTAFVAHCIARYGIDEVRQWYFEVWNEPNLRGFFTGTRSEYYRLYQVTAAAIKAIDPALRVGGPSTSNFVADTRFDGETEEERPTFAALAEVDSVPWKPVWVEHFLAWCAEHAVPVDFVTTHPYPTDFALDGHGTSLRLSRKREAIIDDLRTLRAIVQTSAYPQAEIHCTEWSSTPSPRDHTHDFPQAATYVVMANLEAAWMVDSLSYWVFSDVFEEGGAGNTIWHGGFGMLNLQGLAKPTFHAYRFLHRLGTETLAQGPGSIVTRREDGTLAALLYHYPAEVAHSVPGTDTPDEAHATLAQGTPRGACITLSGLAPGASFGVETLDADHGWARGAWEAMGNPEPPTREQVAYLQRASDPAVSMVTAGADGTLHLNLTLAPWAVVLIEEIG